MSTNTDNNRIDLPYSYHTFLFPFLWNVSGKVEYKEFEKILCVGTRWYGENWDEAVNSNPAQSNLSADAWRLRYAAYQYFTPAAQDVMFNVGSKGNVWLYRLNLNRELTNQYVIEKGEDTFVLDLTDIRLKVYATGVAVLMISGENHAQRTLDAVNAINEYGRRINMPFLPEGSHPICADRLSIVIDGKEVSRDDYLEFLNALNSAPGEKNVSWNYIMKPIQHLIDGDGTDNGGHRVTTNIRAKSNDFLIKPCIDDRMFVCCLVRDDAFCAKLTGYSTEAQAYHYLSGCDCEKNLHGNLSDELYKFISIETSLTCQNAVMKRTLLERAVYDRWIDYGTVQGISKHSLVCMTGEHPGLMSNVINPFLTQLVEMAALTVVQRSYQLLLFDRISDISEKFNEGTELNDEQFRDIENLQAMYVKCQNQILLPQVTVQEQGIELYDKMQSQMMILESKVAMDEQINNLRDVSTVSHERHIRESDQENAARENRAQKAFNILAVIFSVFSILDPLESSLAGKAWYNGFQWFIVKMGLLALVCLGLIIKPKKKKKK